MKNNSKFIPLKMEEEIFIAKYGNDHDEMFNNDEKVYKYLRRKIFERFGLNVKKKHIYEMIKQIHLDYYSKDRVNNNLDEKNKS